MVADGTTMGLSEGDGTTMGQRVLIFSTGVVADGTTMGLSDGMVVDGTTIVPAEGGTASGTNGRGTVIGALEIYANGAAIGLARASIGNTRLFVEGASVGTMVGVFLGATSGDCATSGGWENEKEVLGGIARTGGGTMSYNGG
jgi:hypothetical protein